MEGAGLADSAEVDRRQRLRVAVEVVYLTVCGGLVVFAPGSDWYFLMVLLTLPWGALIWFLSTFAWGGLLVGMRDSQATHLVQLGFFGAAALNVAAARRLIPSRGTIPPEAVDCP